MFIMARVEFHNAQPQFTKKDLMIFILYAPQATPQAVLEVVSEATPQVVSEATPQVSEAAPQAVSEAVLQAVSEAVLQAVSEAVLQAMSQATPIIYLCLQIILILLQTIR